MKKLIMTLTAFAAVLCGCADVSELGSRVDSLEGRVDALENLVEEANARIDVIKALVDAKEENLYIQEVQDIENGVKITFSNGKVVALRNGEKGAKGDKGIQGDKGETGAAPIVTIDVYNNVSYWKVNDEWVLVNNEKVSAVGVTPELRIDADSKKWQISYDKGLSWQDVAPAYDESTAITISQTDDEVIFTLYDNTEYRIAKVPGFKFKVSDVADIAMEAGSSRDIPYTVSKGDETVRFIVQADNYAATVVPTDNTSGVIRVTAPDPIVEGWVLVTAVQNSTGETKSQYLEFGHGAVSVVLEAQQVETLGGAARIALRTNIGYTVDIPVADQEWIELAETRAYKVDTLIFSVKPNYTGAPRQSTITVTPADGSPTSFVIAQEGEAITPEFGLATASPVAKDYLADTLLVKVTGTVVWTVELSAGLTASKLSGAGPADIIVNLPKNESISPAVHTVTVTTTNDSIAEKSLTVTVNQAGAPDPNDYYALFMAGEDIVINGETFNRENYPVEPRLVKLYELSKADDLVSDAATKGILFLDWNEADGQTDTYAPAFNLKPANIVIIGRYRNHQPHINLQTNGSLSWGPTGTKVVFKNVEITSQNYMFISGNATEPLSFSIEDCTLNCNNYYVFCESKAGGYFSEIVIGNSVINFTRGLWGNTSALVNETVLTNFTKCHVTNSVLYGKEAITYPTFPFRPSSKTFYATPNLDLNLDHCTLYNIQNNNLGIYSIYNAAKINFNYCVCEAALTAAKTSTVVIVPGVLDPKVTDSSISNNYCNNSDGESSLKWAYGYSAALNSGITQSGNKMVIGATPFTSTDTATGYFPVNTTVVTNGAGASYETKLWKSWE